MLDVFLLFIITQESIPQHTSSGLEIEVVSIPNPVPFFEVFEARIRVTNRTSHPLPSGDRPWFLWWSTYRRDRYEDAKYDRRIPLDPSMLKPGQSHEFTLRTILRSERHAYLHVVISNAPQDLVRSTQVTRTHKVFASRAFRFKVQPRALPGVLYGRIAGSSTFVICIILLCIGGRDAWKKYFAQKRLP